MELIWPPETDTEARCQEGPPATVGERKEPAPGGGAARKPQRSIPIFDRNALVHLGLLGASIALSVALGTPLGLFLYPCVFWLNELADLRWGRSLLSHTICVRRGYQWFDTFLDHPEDGARDLTEGLFDGTDKTVAQAVRDKYDHILNVLGLRPGDSLLDIGCGYGQFIAHARARGIHARGMTLSAEQAASAQGRGLDVICADGREPPGHLAGQFDAITYLGCLEHFASIQDWHRPERQDEVYRRVFETAARLLKPDSPVRRIFSSTLHRASARWGGWDHLCGYLMLRHYGGLYPEDSDGLTRNCGPWFEVLGMSDRSDDYRLTSVKDKRHFGDFSIRWTPRRLLALLFLPLIDPYALHKWGYHLLGVWMWQFGSAQRAARPERLTRLWWILYQAAPAAGAPASMDRGLR